MTGTYHQEVILAMELDRSHIGKLVQIITDSWSMTGTLTRVDQHDNREWEIDYSDGYGLIPKSGEIYTTLQLGPWRGDVIGNQPVTVETVKGTLEAPEAKRARLLGAVSMGFRSPNSARAAMGMPEVPLEGKVLDDLPPAPAEWPDLPDHADPDDPHPELPC